MHALLLIYYLDLRIFVVLSDPVAQFFYYGEFRPMPAPGSPLTKTAVQ